jgi:hypothetical protein
VAGDGEPGGDCVGEAPVVDDDDTVGTCAGETASAPTPHPVKATTTRPVSTTTVVRVSLFARIAPIPTSERVVVMGTVLQDPVESRSKASDQSVSTCAQDPPHDELAATSTDDGAASARDRMPVGGVRVGDAGLDLDSRPSWSSTVIRSNDRTTRRGVVRTTGPYPAVQNPVCRRPRTTRRIKAMSRFGRGHSRALPVGVGAACWSAAASKLAGAQQDQEAQAGPARGPSRVPASSRPPGAYRHPSTPACD